MQNFDASEIENFRQINELSADIAQKILKRGMLKKLKVADIKKLLKIFLDPKSSKTHGRPIYYSDIKEIDKDNNFSLELIEPEDKRWEGIMEYHTRTVMHLRQTKTIKLIESDEMSFSASAR